jgi:hypothetical protein
MMIGISGIVCIMLAQKPNVVHELMQVLLKKRRRSYLHCYVEFMCKVHALTLRAREDLME